MGFTLFVGNSVTVPTYFLTFFSSLFFVRTSQLMQRVIPSLLISVFLTVLLLPSCGIFVPSDDYQRGERTTKTTKPPRGNSADYSTMGLRKGIVSDALDLTGVRYKYGGVDPQNGMDCSGMLNYVFQNAGITLRRSSREQVKDGFEIKQKDVQPGDLIFFARSGQVFHVALITDYDGEKMYVVHSTSSKGVIRQEILDNSYWTPKIHSYRDVITRQ